MINLWITIFCKDLLLNFRVIWSVNRIVLFNGFLSDFVDGSLRVYILKQWFFSISVNSGFRNIYLAASRLTKYPATIYSPRFQRIIVNYSLIHLQFLRASDARLALVASKMACRFAAVPNKEISQIIKQAFPEIHEKGNEVRFGSFNR